MAQPAHGLHDLLNGGSILPLEHGDDLRGLRAIARGCRNLGALLALGGVGRGSLLGRLALRGRGLGGLRATLGLLRGLRLGGRRFGLRGVSQALDALPDAGDRRLRVLELLRRLLARQAVQDRQQALGGPSRSQLGKFLLRW